MAADLDYVGLGIYSVAEAARLTEVSPQRITRWLRGYEHGRGDDRIRSPRVWESDLPELNGTLELSFKDLMEVRFVARFRKVGVSWNTLRKTHAAASETLKTNHPFSTNRFRTDGREIFLDLTEGSRERGVLEIRTKQRYFDEIVRGMFKDIETAGDELLRWWPLGLRRRVVLDPTRNFGAPIVREGVATRIIALASTSNSAAEISRWYKISPQSVRDALQFEKSQRRKLAA